MTCITTNLIAYASHLSDPAVGTAGKDLTRALCVKNGGKYAELSTF